jgi:transposase
MAFNWARETISAGIDRFHTTGKSTLAPSFYGLRKRWNHTAKHVECVDTDTGAAWWREVSKEAFADGIKGAVDGYWRWQKSRAGKLTGRRVGFPRRKKKGRDPDRYTITTGTMRLDGDRRHLSLPHVGSVRTLENTVQPIGWAKTWTCQNCGAVHDRDDNAAINLARWTPPSGDLGGVAAPVKGGAEHKTRPRRAVGQDTRQPQPDNPLDGATS